MTMVHLSRKSRIRRRITDDIARTMAVTGICALAVLGCLVAQTPLFAQRATIHYRHSGSMPPGAIGREQLSRGGPLRGYYQPVKMIAPQGAKVSFAVDGRFQKPQLAPATAGLLVGQVYRLQVTQIPANEGFEVYPTVEIINRLYPPQGQKARFPIPIELTQEELQYALAGKLVTRIIYLEDPETALPRAEDPKRQRYFEVAADQDPLKTADRLGRPMAILRIGSRVPSVEGADDGFFFGSPPLVQYGEKYGQ
jgi:hypothetical protein